MIGDLLLILSGMAVGAVLGHVCATREMRRRIISAEAHCAGWRHVARMLSDQLQRTLSWHRLQDHAPHPPEYGADDPDWWRK